MATSVQFRLERMVDDLNRLQRTNVFTPEEIRDIVERRREFEYRLKRQDSRKEDFIRYIGYEINLEKTRRERTGHKKARSSGEFGIRNIHSIFERAVRKFQDDLNLWLTWIDFCIRFKCVSRLDRVLGQVVRYHPLKAGVWILCGMHEYHRKDFGKARTMMQQGLRFLPKSRLLWREYFRFELLSCVERNENELVPVVVFDNAMESIGDLDLCQEFIDTYHETTAGFSDVLEHIYSTIREKYMDDPRAVGMLAMRHLYGIESGSEMYFVRMKLAMEELNAGLERVSTCDMMRTVVESVARMMMDVRDDSGVAESVDRQMTRMFRYAKKKGLMTADIYLMWIDWIRDRGKIEEVVDMGLTEFPESGPLWYWKIKNMVDREMNASKIEEELRQAVQHVSGADTVDLTWMYLEKILSENTSIDRAEAKVVEWWRAPGHPGCFTVLRNVLEGICPRWPVSRIQALYRQIRSGSEAEVAECFVNELMGRDTHDSEETAFVRDLFETLVRARPQDVEVWTEMALFEKKTGNYERMNNAVWRGGKATGQGERLAEEMRKRT